MRLRRSAFRERLGRRRREGLAVEEGGGRRRLSKVRTMRGMRQRQIRNKDPGEEAKKQSRMASSWAEAAPCTAAARAPDEPPFSPQSSSFGPAQTWTARSRREDWKERARAKVRSGRRE